jgi:hypothetical protein
MTTPDQTGRTGNAREYMIAVQQRAGARGGPGPG